LRQQESGFLERLTDRPDPQSPLNRVQIVPADRMTRPALVGDAAMRFAARENQRPRRKFDLVVTLDHRTWNPGWSRTSSTVAWVLELRQNRSCWPPWLLLKLRASMCDRPGKFGRHLSVPTDQMELARTTISQCLTILQAQRAKPPGGMLKGFTKWRSGATNNGRGDWNVFILPLSTLGAA
jgi:hypothetical protein